MRPRERKNSFSQRNSSSVDSCKFAAPESNPTPQPPNFAQKGGIPRPIEIAATLCTDTLLRRRFFPALDQAFDFAIPAVHGLPHKYFANGTQPGLTIGVVC